MGECTCVLTHTQVLEHLGECREFYSQSKVRGKWGVEEEELEWEDEDEKQGEMLWEGERKEGRGAGWGEESCQGPQTQTQTQAQAPTQTQTNPVGRTPAPPSLHPTTFPFLSPTHSPLPSFNVPQCGGSFKLSPLSQHLPTPGSSRPEMPLSASFPTNLRASSSGALPSTRTSLPFATLPTNSDIPTGTRSLEHSTQLGTSFAEESVQAYRLNQNARAVHTPQLSPPPLPSPTPRTHKSS